MFNLLWFLPLLFGLIWFYATRGQRARAQLLKKRFSEEDWQILKEHARIVTKAPASIRSKIEGLTYVLIAEKNSEFIGEFDDSGDQMRLVTMAQAALLLVGRDHQFFPRLRSVIFYPNAFKGGRDEESTRLGESWGSGSVVLSWHSVCKGGEDHKDGHNVVIHEFAHQLDQETGWGDGVPLLNKRGDYAEWSRIFQADYEDFCAEVDRGERTVLDDYGATNPAEFFAVATETFFEKADQLKEVRPKLYEQLERYYGLDPSSW